MSKKTKGIIALIITLFAVLLVGTTKVSATENDVYYLTSNDIKMALINQYQECNGVVNWYNNGCLIIRQGHYIINEDIDFASIGVNSVIFEEGEYIFEGSGDIISFGSGFGGTWGKSYNFSASSDTKITFNNKNIYDMRGKDGSCTIIFNGGNYNELDLGEVHVIFNNVNAKSITANRGYTGRNRRN